MTERCPACKFLVFIRENKTIVPHYDGNGRPCQANDLLFCNSWPLYIYLHQTHAWERQECASVELRDSLRVIWRRAGHCTAVTYTKIREGGK